MLLQDLLVIALALLGYTSTLAQNGPVCTTFTNKTTDNGLANNFVSGVSIVGNTIYAATLGGLGISTNGGSTFTTKTAADGLGNNYIYHVYAVGSTVYAATLFGLSISINGGATFTNKTSSDGLLSNNAYDVYVMGSMVYVAMGNTGSGGGLSISADGGATFANKTTANGLGGLNVYRVFAVGSTVYAATGITAGSGGGLSISTNGGSSFTNKTTINGLGSNNVYGVYAVGSTIYAVTQGGLSISTNGGTTFTNKTIANGLGDNNVRDVYVVGSTIYAATLGGLSISTDGGATFTNYTTTNGLGGSAVYDVYTDGSAIYAATGGGFSRCPDAALPVELVSFSAKLTLQGSTQLDWQTAWERNADRFEVQRSLNNLEQFQTLGTLAAQGTTDIRQTYRFTDLNPAEGINYYRLKQSDRDGSVQYSQIVAVTINPDQPLLSIQTNPITDGRLQIRLRKWQTADLQLTTNGGRFIATLPTTNADGTLTLQPLQPLAAGVYILMAKRVGQQQSVRVIWSQ